MLFEIAPLLCRVAEASPLIARPTSDGWLVHEALKFSDEVRIARI